MKAAKRKRLEAKGWRLTSAEEFLGLTREEVALVEMKLALADAVKAQREKSHLSQIEVAARMKSSQSRVAKIEAGDPSVSLDLLVRALVSAGATKKEVAGAFAATGGVRNNRCFPLWRCVSSKQANILKSTVLETTVAYDDESRPIIGLHPVSRIIHHHQNS